MLGICFCGPAIPWSRLGTLPGPVAECFVLYVDPPAQRQGIGRVLIAEASESLASKAFRTLVIGVLTANTSARALYERLGGTRTHLDEDTELPETVYTFRLVESWVPAPERPCLPARTHDSARIGRGVGYGDGKALPGNRT